MDDPLIGHMRETVRQVEEHEHPSRTDLYCLNLTSYMGERMKAVLARYDEKCHALRVAQDRLAALADWRADADA